MQRNNRFCSFLVEQVPTNIYLRNNLKKSEQVLLLFSQDHYLIERNLRARSKRRIQIVELYSYSSAKTLLKTPKTIGLNLLTEHYLFHLPKMSPLSCVRLKTVSYPSFRCFYN